MRSSRNTRGSTKASSVSAYLELGRWQNCLIAAAGVLVGALWAGWTRPEQISIAALTALAFTFAANAFNDAADEALDAIAHPTRPVPSGRIAATDAEALGRVALVAGVVLAQFIGVRWLGALGVLVAGLIIVYTISLKRTGLPGNAVVAVLASLPFVYGAAAAGNANAGWLLVAIAIPLHLAREIAKDIDDLPGDLGHRRTVPIRWGLPAARRLIVVALIVFAVQIIPVARGWPRLAWLMLPALLLTAIGGWRSTHGLPGAPRALKAAMVCTMLAFVIVRI